jgi:hypothetical protein
MTDEMAVLLRSASALPRLVNLDGGSIWKPEFRATMRSKPRSTTRLIALKSGDVKLRPRRLPHRLRRMALDASCPWTLAAGTAVRTVLRRNGGAGLTLAILPGAARTASLLRTRDAAETRADAGASPGGRLRCAARSVDGRHERRRVQTSRAEVSEHLQTIEGALQVALAALERLRPTEWHRRWQDGLTPSARRSAQRLSQLGEGPESSRHRLALVVSGSRTGGRAATPPHAAPGRRTGGGVPMIHCLLRQAAPGAGSGVG